MDLEIISNITHTNLGQADLKDQLYHCTLCRWKGSRAQTHYPQHHCLRCPMCAMPLLKIPDELLHDFLSPQEAIIQVKCRAASLMAIFKHHFCQKKIGKILENLNHENARLMLREMQNFKKLWPTLNLRAFGKKKANKIRRENGGPLKPASAHHT
jgi:hypothetical protein